MTELPAIERPNGKLYRPRKIRVTGWDPEDWGHGWDRPPQTAVLGTHDIEVARQHATSGFTCHYLINPTLGWMRQSMRNGDPWWVDDEVRGAACVIFDESDDPPEVSAALRGGEQ